MEEKIIKKLKLEGYNNVYVYEAEPNEVDEEHTHDFDTKLHVLLGQIRIKTLEGGTIVDFALKSGDEKVIPRNSTHSAIVSSEGCKYIVAEKH